MEPGVCDAQDPSSLGTLKRAPRGVCCLNRCSRNQGAARVAERLVGGLQGLLCHCVMTNHVMTNHVTPMVRPGPPNVSFLRGLGHGEQCPSSLRAPPGHLLPARASVGKTEFRWGTTLYVPNNFTILMFENVAKVPRWIPGAKFPHGLPSMTCSVRREWALGCAG